MTSPTEEFLSGGRRAEILLSPAEPLTDSPPPAPQLLFKDLCVLLRVRVSVCVDPVVIGIG